MNRFFSDLLNDLSEQLRGFTFQIKDGFYLEGKIAVIRSVPFRRGRPGCADLEVNIEPFAFEDILDEDTARGIKEAMQEAADVPKTGTQVAGKRDREWWARPYFKAGDLAGIQLHLSVRGQMDPVCAETRPGGKATFPGVPLDAECELSAGSTVQPVAVLAFVKSRQRLKPGDMSGKMEKADLPALAAESAGTPRTPSSTFHLPEGQLQARVVQEAESFRLELFYHAHGSAPRSGKMAFGVAITRQDAGEPVWQSTVTVEHRRQGLFVGAQTLPDTEIPLGSYRIKISSPAQSE